ncbi:HAD family phosphatase [Flavobacteriaceae bacterium 3-367]|uniref:HAD family hydrolase n=1 Tax=Eudoraea algarum TaxID=3417568 RepID=UPI003269E88E
MIKNIIFDFGDIFINLDKPATLRELGKLGFETITPQIESLAQSYESGLISTEKFVEDARNSIPMASTAQLISAWNAIILGFPEYRLNFIENLSGLGSHRLFLLSNTNALHIATVKEHMGLDRYVRFKECFEKFYLSHEIHLRKPDADCYLHVLRENDLEPSETLFIDDTKENTDAASALGIKTWHLKVGVEDIITLNSRL